MDEQQEEALVECVHHFLFNRLWGWWATIASGDRPAEFDSASSTDALTFFVHWLLVNADGEVLGAFLGREGLNEIERRMNRDVALYTEEEDRGYRFLVGTDFIRYREGVGIAQLLAVIEALPPDAEVRVEVARLSAVNDSERVRRGGNEARDGYQRDYARFRVDYQDEEALQALERQGVTRQRIEQWQEFKREREQRQNRNRGSRGGAE